jgi:hypothetical protein
VHSFKDCPICLETFEEDPRIITILCSHKFHYKCLSDWRDQTCPVCRYQQYPFELTFCEKLRHPPGPLVLHHLRIHRLRRRDPRVRPHP